MIGRLQIDHVNRLLVANRPTRDCGAVIANRLPRRPTHRARQTSCRSTDHAVIGDEDIYELRLANTGRVFGNDIEDRFDLARRP